MTEKQIIELIRFNDFKEIKNQEAELKKYCAKIFSYGITDNNLVNPVLIKLSVYPSLFNDIAAPYIGLDLNTYRAYLEMKKPYASYFSKYAALIDHNNLLESLLADRWGMAQGRNNNYIKYILIKTAFKFGITKPDNMYFAWDGKIIRNRDLRILRSYNKIFKDLFADDTYQFPYSFLDNLALAFKELYHEVQNKEFKENLKQNNLNEEEINWLKEIQIINFDPYFYYANQDDFMVNITALSEAINFLFAHYADKLTKDELLALRKQLTILNEKKAQGFNQTMTQAFETLPNIQEIKNNFPVLRK